MKRFKELMEPAQAKESVVNLKQIESEISINVTEIEDSERFPSDEYSSSGEEVLETPVESVAVVNKIEEIKFC